MGETSEERTFRAIGDSVIVRLDHAEWFHAGGLIFDPNANRRREPWGDVESIGPDFNLPGVTVGTKVFFDFHNCRRLDETRVMVRGPYVWAELDIQSD